MKSPLGNEEPFAPVTLTPEQERGCTQLAEAVLRDGLRAFDLFVTQQKRVLPPQDWKPIWSREKVTVYKQLTGSSSLFQSSPSTSSFSSSSSSSASASTSSCLDSSSTSSSLGAPVHASTPPPPRGVAYYTDWALPRLTCVGSIVGSLDDALFGAYARSRNEMRVRTEYVHDELVDCRVLQQLRSPTESNPFQSFSLRWLLSGSTGGGRLVRARDAVFIESLGMHVLPSGERIGYLVMHTVQVPSCPELSAYKVVRGEFMSCYMYRQRDAHSVEVYVRTTIDPRGNVPESLALLGIAKSVVGCWKNTWCGQNKKLAWMLKEATASRKEKDKGHHRQQQQQQQQQQDVQSARECSLCAKSLAFRSTKQCSLCQLSVCSRCATVRKLPFISRRRDEPESVRFLFCVRCITMTARINAINIMRKEYVVASAPVPERSATGSRGGPRRGDTYTHTQGQGQALGQSQGRGLTIQDLGSQLDHRDLSGRQASQPAPQDSMHRSGLKMMRSQSSGSWSPTSSNDDTGSVYVETYDSWAREVEVVAHPEPELEPVPVANASDYQQQLWARMQQLRVAAEETYLITQSTNAAMVQLHTTKAS